MITVSTQQITRNIDSWLAMRLRMNHRASGVESNERDMRIFAEFLRQRRIRKVQGTTLLEFITYLKMQRNNGVGAINRKISSLKSFFRYLRFLQVEGSEQFPIQELPRAREPYTGPIQALQPQEVKALFDSMDTTSVLGYRDMLIFSLMYRLGLRISEVSGLDIADVNLNENLITIHGKGGRARVLPLVDALAAQLEKWLMLRTRLLNADSLPALFISKKGKRIANRTIQEHFQQCVKKAGPFEIEKVTPHSLRHAFASHAIEGDADLVVLKHIMGHARMSSTHIYLHPSINMQRKAVNDHLASDIIRELISADIGVASIQERRKKRKKAA